MYWSPMVAQNVLEIKRVGGGAVQLVEVSWKLSFRGKKATVD